MKTAMTLLSILFLYSCGCPPSKTKLEDLTPPVVIVAFAIPATCSDQKYLLVADRDSIINRICYEPTAKTGLWTIGDTIKR